MSNEKDKLVAEHFDVEDVKEDDQYALQGGDVLQIVAGLLQLVLAFMPPEQAKREIDRAWAQRINDVASAAEDAKFAKVDQSKN